ncbi:DNA polymerase III subunit delta [Chloroflexota bacterium]
MLYILSGQNDFSLTQSLEEIKREIDDPAIFADSTTTLDGQQVTLDQLSIACETLPFLAGRRLVIIKGLLERFDPRGRPNRRKKTTGTKQQDEYKPFNACISRMPDSTTLVLAESRIAGNNPLFRELADKAVVKSFPLLKNTELGQWIQRRVAEEGSSISPQAVDLLAKLVGSNLWIMASEINKLVLFTLGRRIDENDVKTVVSYAQQTNVFAMVDAIVEFKAELAAQLLQQLLQSGAPPAYLLVMLSRQVRMIVIAGELNKQRKPRTEIQHKLGLNSDFALRKTLEQSRRYSLPRLKEIYRQLLETDLSIKTGQYDTELALNILVTELCQRGKTSVSRSGPGLN